MPFYCKKCQTFWRKLRNCDVQHIAPKILNSYFWSIFTLCAKSVYWVVNVFPNYTIKYFNRLLLSKNSLKVYRKLTEWSHWHQRVFVNMKKLTLKSVMTIFHCNFMLKMFWKCAKKCDFLRKIFHPPLQPSPESMGTIWICQGMGIYIPQLLLKQLCEYVSSIF